ncbi:MAG: M20/M25/M40 family metallo-hydrolase, partial [Chloroflexaceae bacterium]|nr:M20/M25/M40 family metallo-hydrolase [Chloroflexaceae bacterium]
MDPQRWRHTPAIQAALRSLDNYHPILETAIAIQQIPAPTFDEGRRGAYVQQRMAQLGLCDVSTDEIGNVYGRRPGQNGGKAVLVSAHLDTVFPHGTDLSLRHEGDRVYGPGLGDNSTGLAGLLHLAQACQAHNLPHAGDVWFVANVGEEGLGDLRGIRATIDRLQPLLGAAIAIEGCDFATLHHQAIGVRRYKVEVRAPGGHSWGDFGNPSAIHVLSLLAARIAQLEVPATPRTTFNIGMINGGTSVNTIAQQASLLLDMRSVELASLNQLIGQVDALINEVSRAHRGVRVHVTTVGDRPAGAIPRDHPLVRAATESFRAVGARVNYQQGSTDANIPLSRGLPAVCIGLTDGGNAHRSDEFIQPANLGRGVQALLLLTMAA